MIKRHLDVYKRQIPGRAVQLEARPAEGWTNLPESKRPPLEFDIVVPPTYVEGYPMHVLMYASTDTGYDRMLISESKDAAQALSLIHISPRLYPALADQVLHLPPGPAACGGQYLIQPFQRHILPLPYGCTGPRRLSEPVRAVL